MSPWLVPNLGPPLCDEARGGAQGIGFRAERVQSGFGFRYQFIDLLVRTSDPENRDEGAFARGGVLARRFAQSGRVALDIEQIVGNLKSLTDRPAISVERLAHALIGL